MNYLDYMDEDDEEEEMTDVEYDQQSCNICGKLEIAGTLGMEGVPWAFNICSSSECCLIAEQKLENALKGDL
jgi:hypothetical protein